MTMSKYAGKYATKRAVLAKKRGVIEIDMNTGEEITEDETVEVITNKTPQKKEETVENTIPVPEPQLQTIEVEEPKVNALKATIKATTPKRAASKKTTTKKKTSTTTRRRRTTTTSNWISTQSS